MLCIEVIAHFVDGNTNTKLRAKLVSFKFPRVIYSFLTTNQAAFNRNNSTEIFAPSA